MLLLYLLLSVVPLDNPIQDSVDIIEINHYYDEKGDHVFDQALYWNWNRASCRHEIVDWKLIKEFDRSLNANQLLNKPPEHLFLDTSQFRRVRADEFRETWTQYDPELIDRTNVEKDHRKHLTPHVRWDRALEYLKTVLEREHVDTN